MSTRSVLRDHGCSGEYCPGVLETARVTCRINCFFTHMVIILYGYLTEQNTDIAYKQSPTTS